MVLIELPASPGDIVTRRFKQGARGTATVRDMDAQQINFLVNRSDNLQPAKLEQNYKITDGEEFAIIFSRPLLTHKEVFSPDSHPPRKIFTVGQKILLKRQIANYFLMKLYGELLSSSPFMNVYFSNRSLVTHGEIVRILEEGVVIKAINKPKPTPRSDSSTPSNVTDSAPSNSPSAPIIPPSSTNHTGSSASEPRDTSNINQSSSSSSSPSSSSSSSSSSIDPINSPFSSSSSSSSSSSERADTTEESSEQGQEFFVSNNDLKFVDLVDESISIEHSVELIMKMISVQPGDEVTIKGSSENRMVKVKSITVPLSDPLQKKVTMEGIQVSFRASNLTLHSKTVSGTDNQTVHLKNGHRYKKVFWSRDRKQLLGVFFDEDNKILRAETIDESNIVKKATWRPNPLQEETPKRSILRVI